MSENHKIWFITGISRGLGLELARAVLAKGDIVVGTTRDGDSDLSTVSHRLHVLPLELPLANQTRKAVMRAHALHGRLDVIVNDAGYGLLGAIEEAGAAEVRRVFDVNFFGSLQVIQAALPFLRARRPGHMVDISSIAGLVPLSGSGIYAATKFALEGLSESLAQEWGRWAFGSRWSNRALSAPAFYPSAPSATPPAQLPLMRQTSGNTVRHLHEIAGKQPGNPSLGDPRDHRSRRGQGTTVASSSWLGRSSAGPREIPASLPRG